MNEITQAAATLGKLGGKSKSPAKQQAARENGRKGGRPGWCPLCGERHGSSGTPGYSCYRADEAEIEANLGCLMPGHPDYDTTPDQSKP